MTKAVLTPIITRFAPSPTGDLHLGHAYSALLAHDFARANDGKFILRFEDIDQTRVRPQFYRDIEIDLEWLGIKWDEKPIRQSDHFADYQKDLDKLKTMGLLYPCFKTRAEIAYDAMNAPHGPDNFLVLRDAGKEIDNETIAKTNGNIPFAWRFWAHRAKELLGDEELFFTETNGNSTKIDPLLLGDAILARKDTPASYHLCVVHDDARQNITHIIRGEDLRQSTHIHRVLQHFLSLPVPLYQFHKLLVGADGKRFAKRDKAQGLKYLRNSGITPDKIRELIAQSRKM
ncbi:tRNA glutamyl-Q(34) synthetase GluQRS [Pseudaquidulcibacter saccharophilus]|uniref:tRNA glutamyl-Q(34) synthetase GluQRS n=1 Tax=Pseudaquidulcibacter saccharophilus TaxID=2831900 RepID=UPI001EFF33B5|nr:tRNA glutamyl-Q(34) synthetase GluQRS [Pseudaquidulcibacter saccharophilus]